MIIVGGANSAGQAAVFFSRFAAKVTLAVRGDSLEKSMSSYLIEQIAGIPNIEVRLNTSVQGCSGNDRLQCVTFVDHGGGQEVVDSGHLFVFIGAAPLTDWLPPSLVRDASGFVVTGPDADRRWQAACSLGSGARAIPAGVQHPGCLRGR